MSTEGSDNILGVDTQQLAAVVSRLPDLPNVRFKLADRFAQAVRRLVEKRAQNAWPNEGDADLAVFILVDHPREIGGQHGATSFADPLAQDCLLLGNLFFATHDASRGQFISMPISPNAILDWIEDQGLGECPIVMVYRESRRMVTRRAGTKDCARYDPIRDKKPAATLSELMKALGHFHRSRLLTPTVSPDGLWERNCAARYIPGSSPERTIQSILEVAISSWFHGVVKIGHEVDTNIGRIDVVLLTRNEDGAFSYWVILELKIIKSFTNSLGGSNSSPVAESDNVNAIAEGVIQAGSYRENSGTTGLLEVYDLRKDKTQDLTRREKVLAAKQRFVPPPEIHVWRVYGSSRDARDAGFTGN